MMLKSRQTGFTLVEIAIVLLIVTILLGYTVAMFPQQQKLKQYRAVDLEMDRVMEAIIGFAQATGRLPCPAIATSSGLEDFDGDGSDADLVNGALPDGCYNYGGFVPANTLGLSGRLNEDFLLLDPWGNPYRYYVTEVDFNGNELSDFIMPGEMRSVGLVNTDGDDYIDLDGRYLICSAAGINNNCDSASEVFGNFEDNGGGAADRYGGAPFVLLSMGKNWRDAAPAGDELINSGATVVTGTSGTTYRLKNYVSLAADDPDDPASETTFVKRTTGLADDFDDVVRWASPSVLYSRMIQADQLP